MIQQFNSTKIMEAMNNIPGFTIKNVNINSIQETRIDETIIQNKEVTKIPVFKSNQVMWNMAPNKPYFKWTVKVRHHASNFSRCLINHSNITYNPSVMQRNLWVVSKAKLSNGMTNSKTKMVQVMDSLHKKCKNIFHLSCMKL